NQPVKPGSVLLVDDTKNDFLLEDPTQTIAHVDVTRYYEQALTAIGRSYTYWNRAEQGPPSLKAMKAASAVIYFTGANLRGLAAENQDPESALPPLTSADDSLLQQYVDAGGHLFVTGMGAAQSGGFDPYFTAAALGGVPSSLSAYDSKTNDTDQ